MGAAQTHLAGRTAAAVPGEVIRAHCRPRQPVGVGGAGAVRLEGVLAADFAEYRRGKLPFWTDPTPAPVPEGVEPWPHDPGPPFEQWPGLAPELPLTSEGSAPEEAASSLLAGLIETGRFGLDACRLVLVPAHRSGDALALIGWSAKAPLPLLCALLRSWEDRFGAQVVAVFGSELYVSVARPPVEAEHANLLALEHVLSTADNIVDDPPTPFPEYAAELVGRTSWSFWWD
ncbi:hypothetical protein QFZ82_006909 [Streptomyces sp. V4I23]|uniref:DUF4253 domain-containing protein n=1 Tax=Streptomyces sp. V4I23 TaxID=3042282 RepID=UPI0027807799|nr:DUF4253 domain-containing protein [Streptomyces sp. V4I23]MDQ1012424.1 hypothetical protein [Streptomyces sp. V4I23]